MYQGRMQITTASLTKTVYETQSQQNKELLNEVVPDLLKNQCVRKTKKYHTYVTIYQLLQVRI